MSLKRQLKSACAAAGFTQTEMALWLQYDYRTVQLWLTDKTSPLPRKHKHIKERLNLLKAALTAFNGELPVPSTVGQYQRRAFVQGLRDRALKQLSVTGTSD